VLWSETDSPAESIAGYELGFRAKYLAFLCAEALQSQLCHGLLDIGLDVKDNLTQREHGKSPGRPCFAGKKGWDTDLPPKAAALFQTAVSREMLCPVVMTALERGLHTLLHRNPCYWLLSDMLTSSDRHHHQRKMLLCSVAESDTKLVGIGTSRAGIQKQNALVGKRKN